MVKGWTDYVTGKQLIYYRNIFRRQAYINIDYLIDLYKSDKCYLDLKKLKKTKPELYCTVTDYETKEPVILDLKKNDVFQVMRATCAVPLLYHKKILIDGKRYYNGSLSINKVFNKIIDSLLANDYDKIIIIVNRQGLVKSKHPRISIIEPSRLPLRGHLDTDLRRVSKTIEQGRQKAKEFIKKYGLIASR